MGAVFVRATPLRLPPPPVTGVIGQLTAKTRESSSNPCHLTQRRLPYNDIIQTTSSSHPSTILLCIMGFQSINYYIHFKILLTLHQLVVTSLHDCCENFHEWYMHKLGRELKGSIPCSWISNITTISRTEDGALPRILVSTYPFWTGS